MCVCVCVCLFLSLFFITFFLSFFAIRDDEMKTLFKMATCVSVLVAMLFAAALSHGEFVMHFHQDMGHHAQQIGFTPDHPDRGYVKNCGKFTVCMTRCWWLCPRRRGLWDKRRTENREIASKHFGQAA